MKKPTPLQKQIRRALAHTEPPKPGPLTALELTRQTMDTRAKLCPNCEVSRPGKLVKVTDAGDCRDCGKPFCAPLQPRPGGIMRPGPIVRVPAGQGTCGQAWCRKAFGPDAEHHYSPDQTGKTHQPKGD